MIINAQRRQLSGSTTKFALASYALWPLALVRIVTAASESKRPVWPELYLML